MSRFTITVSEPAAAAPAHQCDPSTAAAHQCQVSPVAHQCEMSAPAHQCDGGPVAYQCDAPAALAPLAAR